MSNTIHEISDADLIKMLIDIFTLDAEKKLIVLNGVPSNIVSILTPKAHLIFAEVLQDPDLIPLLEDIHNTLSLMDMIGT